MPPADGHTFEKPFPAEAEEHELPCCEECGVEDDNLWGDVCQECAEYSAPTAGELYRSERTW